MSRFIWLAAALVPMGVACVGEGDPPEEGPGGGGGEATIAITGPGDGEGVYGAEAPLTWTVTGLTLDAEAIGGADAAGHGHVHVYVDGVLVEETAEESTTLTALLAGEHTVEVRLAENGHAELSASDVISLPVALATLSLTSPLDGARLATSTTALTLAIGGFAMSNAIGGSDVFGEGHYIVSVDGGVHFRSADPTQAEATGIPLGVHTVQVELVGNRGKALSSPVIVERTIEVLPTALGVYFDRTALGEPFDSATLPLTVSVANLVLVDSEGAVPPVPGEGHFHLFLDGLWLDSSILATRVLQHLPGGPHLFEARLTTNDDLELPVVDRMWVDIPADRPDIRVTYPGPDWHMDSAFELLFEAENFTLDPLGMDGANGVDTGHANIYLDGSLVGETGYGTWALSGLAPGAHLLRVELVNNDRTPLEPPVYDEFVVFAEATTP